MPRRGASQSPIGCLRRQSILIHMVFYLGRFIRRNEKKTLCTVSVPVHGDDAAACQRLRRRHGSPVRIAAGGASVTSVNPVETPDTHITFKFYNGETLLDTQVVNDDGQLTAPATPAIESGRKFLGWYAVDANGQLEAQEFDFSTAYTNYSGRQRSQGHGQDRGRVLRVLYDR